MSRLQQLMSDLSAAASSPDEALLGMPGAFYTDAEFFAHERNTVLWYGWHCLGRVDEIPSPGDFFTVQLLDEPLLVVRGDDDVVRVLSNICRHRGMPLAEGRGSSKRFICSYHAWTYGRDGQLLRAARMNNSRLDVKNCRLPEFNSFIWRGAIYCSLDDAAVPFIEENQGLDALVENYEPEQFRLVHVAEEDWRCNWKSLVENFMEGYHLSVVHPETLHGYTPTGLSKKATSGPGFTSYLANYPDSAASRGEGSERLSADQRKRSTLYSVFPCQVASQSATLLVSLTIIPKSADLIGVKWTMSTYGNQLDEATVAERVKLWEEVNAEDREKLERMQVALRSAHALAGPLAGQDFEGTIHDFHVWMDGQLNDGLNTFDETGQQAG